LIKGDQSPAVNLVIVGGGATGVELSAELLNVASSLRHYGLTDFDENRIRLTLLEAGDRLLPALPEKLSIAAIEELKSIGVDVRLNTVVSEVYSEQILTENGEIINSDITVWAAGVKGAKYLANLDSLATDRLDRLIVNEHLQTTADPAVFAMGDCASFTPSGSTKPLPPRAQAAHQMARTVYENIISLAEDRDLRPFIYNDRGSLVSLSRFSTVGSLMGNLIGGRLAIEGRLARIAYMSLYRLHLLAIHGWLRGTTLILVGHVNRIARPKLKVH
jgi:NADH dehydrogenase